MPTVRPYSPCTMTSGATGCVVACTPYRLNAGSSIASTAATTIGKCGGSHPAITALTASFSSVACRHSGGMAPSDRSGGRPPSMAMTRSSVGGTTGNPSHQRRSQKAARTAWGSSSTSRKRSPGPGTTGTSTTLTKLFPPRRRRRSRNSSLRDVDVHESLLSGTSTLTKLFSPGRRRSRDLAHEARELLHHLLRSQRDGFGELAPEGMLDDQQRQPRDPEGAELTQRQALKRGGRDESGGGSHPGDFDGVVET